LSAPRRLRLFEAYGLELEYMIVDRATLDVRPIADKLLEAVAGQIVSDVEVGETAWSNELALHVIELKTNGPAPRLEPLPAVFDEAVFAANRLLEPLGARLLPGGMHPWMDPLTEMRIWPHESGPVYAAFDRIFDCRGHGWANLQSVHLNLPFGDDEREDGEFARLHAAVRAILPILPALAASSPVAGARPSGFADTRLEVYRTNSLRVPSVAGELVPERVFTRRDYEERLLGKIYADMAPLDPEGVLRHEWCNARGAIARFDRSAIEIRLLDVQECPRADVAISALVSDVVEALANGRWLHLEKLKALEVEPLARILRDAIREGERLVIEDRELLSAFGVAEACTAGELWARLADGVWPRGSARAAAWRPQIDVILRAGTLSSRLGRALGAEPSRGRLREVYGELADCLAEGRMFVS